MTDTTSELRQNLTNIYSARLPLAPAMVEDLVNDAMKLLAAQRQQWEAAARKDELRLITMHTKSLRGSVPAFNPEYDRAIDEVQERVERRIAALDGELGKEQ